MKRGLIITSICMVLCICFSSTALSKYEGQEFEKNCTITAVEGPVVETSCQAFVLAEETKITDSSGRSIFIYKIPLPMEASITYICSSDEKCNMITEIRLHRKIEEIPE